MGSSRSEKYDINGEEGAVKDPSFLGSSRKPEK